MNSGNTLSILLLEDQALVRAGMKELVQICEPQSQIHESATYQDAIEKLGAKAYDIAFLDIDLKADKSGLEVLRYIRSAGIDTRAIMLSGCSERDLIMECISEGASGYILKDMEHNGLFRRALDTVFQGGIFLPASALGRGGYTPLSSSNPQRVSPGSIGVQGRPLEVLYYLCQGLPNKTIAAKMELAEGTIRRDYIPMLFRKFRVARRTELIVEISRRGLIIPKPPARMKQ